MKSLRTIIGLIFVALISCGCDSDQDVPGNNNPPVCTGDKSDQSGCIEPDTTESPPGDDVWVGEDSYVGEDNSEDDGWKLGMDPCIPFAEYDNSCFNCGIGYTCVQTTFILNEGMCGIQSSCFGLLYGDPNNPPPRFQDPTNYIAIQDNGNLLAHSTYPEIKDFICPPATNLPLQPQALTYSGQGLPSDKIDT